MANQKDNDAFLDDLEAFEDELAREEQAAAEASDEDVDAMSSVDELIAERDSLKDKWMRALADAENSRKRSDRDRREAENYGGSKLARDLLGVYDNLRRGLDTVNDDQKEVSAALIEGVELTLRELLNVFKKHGIERITPEVGDRFDPQNHEAMFEAPLPGTKAGDIIQVSGEGFMLHDRLLRPAQVGVSSNTA